MKNLEKFLSLLDGEVNGLLLTSRYSRHYGAEFDIAEGMAIVTKKGCRYFTDSRYIEAAENNLPGFTVRMTHPGSSDIERINELARKAKTVGLTPEENEERAKLRRAYIDSVVGDLRQQLDNTYIVDAKGNKRKLRQ